MEEEISPTHEFDPTVFIDNDDAKTPYIIFGHKSHGYYIAQLNNDMMSLAETPKAIVINNSPEWVSAPDWMDKNYISITSPVM